MAGEGRQRWQQGGGGGSGCCRALLWRERGSTASVCSVLQGCRAAAWRCPCVPAIIAGGALLSLLLLCCCCAGITEALVIVTPFEVVKIRLQQQKGLSKEMLKYKVGGSGSRGGAAAAAAAGGARAEV